MDSPLEAKDLKTFFLSQPTLDPSSPGYILEIDLPDPGSLQLLATVTHLEHTRTAHREHLKQVRKARAEAIMAKYAATDMAAGEARAQKRAAQQRKEKKAAMADEMERKRLERVRRDRARPKALRDMTRQELLRRIDKVMEGDAGRGGVQRREGEDDDKWVARLEKINAEVQKLAKAEWKRKPKGKTVYFEGLPLNLRFTAPSLLPLIRPTPRVPTGAGRCLQCLAKDMPCSQTVRHSGGHTTRTPCDRCVRAGDRCIAKWDDHPDKEAYWVYVDERDGALELVQTVKALREVVCERQRREEMAWDLWHENERVLAEVGEFDDEEMTEKVVMWHHVLRGTDM